MSHNDSLWAYGITKSHREQGLYYREVEELSWCQSWSNSLWQRWRTGALYWWKCHWPDLKGLPSSDGISSWTPLKPQHSNPNTNPNPLANQLYCIDLLTPPTPLILPHRIPGFLESLMPLKNWWSIHARWSKNVRSIPHVSVAFFPSLKKNSIAYRYSKVSDWIFEIHQLWQLIGIRTVPQPPYRGTLLPVAFGYSLSSEGVFQLLL